MAGKQAKILTDEQVALFLSFVSQQRHPARNRVIALLSIKAGLRAAEIAKLEWSMVCDPSGNIGLAIELRDHAAKKKSGRLDDLLLGLADIRAAPCLSAIGT